jgi:hypothetical protein
MNTIRYVDKLVSVFDLPSNHHLHPHETDRTRVMLVYDKGENIKRFRILNKELSNEAAKRIASWLEENIDIRDGVFRLCATGHDPSSGLIESEA